MSDLSELNAAGVVKDLQSEISSLRLQVQIYKNKHYYCFAIIRSTFCCFVFLFAYVTLLRSFWNDIHSFIFYKSAQAVGELIEKGDCDSRIAHLIAGNVNHRCQGKRRQSTKNEWNVHIEYFSNILWKQQKHSKFIH